MISKVKSSGLLGIDGYVVMVETDISNGIPSFDIVGLGDTAVRESKERVRTAIKNSRLEFPIRRITVNLAPANQKKEGSAFDLAIAVGIIAASEQLDFSLLDNCIFAGELSLDGELRPVAGILPMAICAHHEGIRYFFVPEANAREAGVVKGIDILPVRNLTDLVEHLRGGRKILKQDVNIDEMFNRKVAYELDFSDVKGQASLKRAMEVAASGGHNLLMIGSPGSGKSMLAKRLPTILPDLSFEEALEVTKIHSIAGILPPNTSLTTVRPFRSPHHTITPVGLIGGGMIPKPGEISLAHHGVLFLDELPEFSRDALEVLRQPLEDESVTISRISGSLTYPSKTTLICAANPCKCGNHLDRDKNCSCTPSQIQNYLGRLSAPLLDRIDIQVEATSVSYNDLEGERPETPSEVIRCRVNKARKIQLERYKGLKIFSNSQLQGSMLSKYCKLDDRGRVLMRNAFERLKISARAHSRILKVARTIADMEDSEEIREHHLAEAIQYRSLDRRIWS